MKTVSTFLLFLCLASTTLAAGESPPDPSKPELPPPKAPYIAKPAKLSAWTMTRLPDKKDAEQSQAGEDGASSPGAEVAGEQAPEPPPALQVVKVDSVIDGPVKEDTVTWSDGQVEQTYWIGSISLRRVRGQSDFMIDFANRTLPSMSGPGFFGTDFVGLENYKGTMLVRKRPAYHYATTLALPSENADSPALAEAREAWIDPVTLLPIAIQGPEGAFLFDFSAAKRSIKPPKEALEAWQGLGQQMRRLGQSAPDIPGFGPPAKKAP